MTNSQAIRDSIRTGTVPLATYLSLMDQYRAQGDELKKTKELLATLTRVVQETCEEGDDLTFDVETGGQG